MTWQPIATAPAMRWPGIRRKLYPVTVVRVPSWGLSITGRADYYGCWRCIHIGPWLIFMGSGEYD
jgi:hypothetical protein